MAKNHIPDRPPIRVVLACEDQAYADRLMEILSAQGVVVLRSGDVDDQQLARADVLLMEIQDLGVGDRQLLTRIRSVAPLMEVVAISAEPMTQNAVRALRTGVFVVLPYPVSVEQLMNALTSARGRKSRAEKRMKQLNGKIRRRYGRARSNPTTKTRRQN